MEEANALLPAVRTLTETIRENILQLRSQSQAIARHEHLDPESTDFMDRLQQNTAIAQLVAAIKSCVEQIQSYGCICKGVEQGLVDFPCLLGAEVVFLCWQLGDRQSAIGTGSKTVFPGAGLCSMSSKETLTGKLLTTNRHLNFSFPFALAPAHFNRWEGREGCDC